MKAIVQNKFDDASVLSYSDVEIPKIGDKECLIKVAYTSVNYADIKERTGKKGKGNFPLILAWTLQGQL